MSSGSSTKPSTVRTMVSTAKFEVEKFDGTNNFGMWQCEVMDVLVHQELDIALEDKPEEMSTKDWEKINRQACGTIRLCLAKDQKYFVMRETKAKELWKKLENKYMTKSVENRLYLKKKLFRFQFREGISLSEHLNDYNKILADLKNLDVEISDEDKALLLLNSLPDIYDHLITTLLYGKDEIKFDDVSNALTNNEYRKKDKQAHRDTISEALIVGCKSNRNFGKDECAYCRKKGHWKKNCPLLKNMDNEDSNVSVAQGSDEDSDFALTCSSFVCHSNEWIMDSTSTCHICPSRELFYHLEEFEGGSIYMGNDQTCKILGIGKIKLKLHDGTVRLLTGVQYIPDFKKNLISVGLLESKGFKIAMENGTLKILNGALVVMMATHHRNLYFLKGSTVVGGAATVSDIIGELASDTTRLLGHADDSALQRLMEQDLLKDVKTCKFEFCELCILGKQIRVKLGIAVHLINGTLDYVHTYVWGLTKVAFFGGRNYFVNDYFRQVWVKGTTDLDLMFDVLFRFVCKFFEEGDTLLQKIGTAKVPWHKFRHCLDLFGICNLD